MRMSGKNYPSRNMEKILKNNNYVYIRSNGDHHIYSNGSNKITITVPMMNKMIVRRLIKENNLKVEDKFKGALQLN